MDCETISKIESILNIILKVIGFSVLGFMAIMVGYIFITGITIRKALLAIVFFFGIAICLAMVFGSGYLIYTSNLISHLKNCGANIISSIILFIPPIITMLVSSYYYGEFMDKFEKYLDGKF